MEFKLNEYVLTNDCEYKRSKWHIAKIVAESDDDRGLYKIHTVSFAEALDAEEYCARPRNYLWNIAKESKNLKPISFTDPDFLEIMRYHIIDPREADQFKAFLRDKIKEMLPKEVAADTATEITTKDFYSSEKPKVSFV